MGALLSFAPVPVRARRDGWTPAVQARFVFELAESGAVAAACRAVGRSWQSAYRLRARADAVGFAAAWDAALARPAPPDGFTGRAMGGAATPITWRGRRVGERRRVDDRLAQYLLRVRSPEQYGVAREDRRPVALDLADALAALARELAAGVAPCDEADSPEDVARTSSPSAPRAARTAAAQLRPRRGSAAGGARADRPPPSRGQAYAIYSRDAPPPAPKARPPPDGQSRPTRR